MSIHHLAVFGNPVNHSRSPDIHRAFAAQTGITLRYEKVLVPAGKFVETAEDFLKQGGLGFNVTLPCKGDAYSYAERLGFEAKQAGAVNTISIDGGHIRGDNTDGRGLVNDLSGNLGVNLCDARILVLGAGGAVAGVLAALVAAQPELVDIYNRTQLKAVQLAERHAACVRAVSSLNSERPYDVVINGTSAGLTGAEVELDSSIFGRETFAYDMVYGPVDTAFIKHAKASGVSGAADGLGMLVEQAALSFEIWFKQAVSAEPLINTLRQEMQE